METEKDIFDIFAHDENYQYIMKRLLEASIYESVVRCEVSCKKFR